MDAKDKLIAEAEALGIDVNRRHSEDTIKERIAEAQAERDANHEPAKSERTANKDGLETKADKLDRVQGDGKTNPVDDVKNTEPGPGNPEYRTPKARHDVPDGVKTEETPKMVHATTTASGPREITNNEIPDMSKRSPLVIMAERYGIMVDPKWDDERLAGEIALALSGRADLQVMGAVPSTTEVMDEPLVKVELLKDVWDADGNRVSKNDGAVRVPRSIARTLIHDGKALRTDPLPGGED